MTKHAAVEGEDAAPYKIFRAGPDHNGNMTVPIAWVLDCYAVEEVLDFETRDDWHYLVFVDRRAMTLFEFKKAHHH